MKKIFLSLLISLIAFSVFSQEPNHNKKPKLFQPGNWYMVGNWDSTAAAYKDTIGFYVENDSIYIWSNKILLIQSSDGMSVTGLINTDSSYYLKGNNILSYYSRNLIIGDSAGLGGIGAASVKIGYAAGMLDNGTANVEIGPAAGGGMTGSENVIIGDQSGALSVTNSSVMIGTNSGLNSNSDSSIYIGYDAGANNVLDKWLFIGSGDTNNSAINGYIGKGNKRLRLNADVYLKNKLSFQIFSATIADTLTPTEAELTTAIGLTPAQAGSGGSFVVKSTSGCLYDIISDGTNYYCTKRKKLW